MQDFASSQGSDLAGNAVRAVPWAVGGSTFFGMSWDVLVNVLVAISVTLQILWFVYEKGNTISKEAKCRTERRVKSKLVRSTRR